MEKNAKEKNMLMLLMLKGESFPAASLFMALIFQQKKMISRLIAKLLKYKKLQKH